MEISTEPRSASTYRVLAASIGATRRFAGWPAPTLDGLFQALQIWTLDPRLNMFGDDPDHPHVAFQAPYRALAWGECVSQSIAGRNSERRFVGTKPIHEGHPDAVHFQGNFLNHSLGFCVATDDIELIAVLDALIAANMATPQYQAAAARCVASQ